MEYTVQMDTTNIDDFYKQLKSISATRVSDKNEKAIVSWDTNGKKTYTY